MSFDQSIVVFLLILLLCSGVVSKPLCLCMQSTLSA